MNNLLNVFWAIVWTIVLALAIAALWWRWAAVIVAVIATTFAVVFVKDYLRIKKFK